MDALTAVGAELSAGMLDAIASAELPAPASLVAVVGELLVDTMSEPLPRLELADAAVDAEDVLADEFSSDTFLAIGATVNEGIPGFVIT